MRSLLADYWRETRGAFERLPVWLPGTRMDLGDVGTFDDDGWLRQTTLAELGISIITEAEGVLVDYNYSSSDSAEVSAWASASGDLAISGVPVGNAGLRIRFSKAGAFVLRAERVGVRRITNLAEVDREILERYRSGTWKPEWVLVNEVARAAASITIVSSSTDAEVFVALGAGAGGQTTGSGATPTGGPGAPTDGTAAAAGGAAGPLVAAGAGLRIGMHRGVETAIAVPGKATVLWRGRRIYHPWWRSDPTMRNRGVRPGSDASRTGGENRGQDSAAQDRATQNRATQDRVETAIVPPPTEAIAAAQVVSVDWPEDLPTEPEDVPAEPEGGPTG